MSAYIEAGVQVAFFKEDGCFIAYCPALNLSAYGDSLEDALESFETTFEIFIEDVTRKDTLYEVLLGLGWTLKTSPHPMFKSPFFRSRDDIESSLPENYNSHYVKSEHRKVQIPVS